MHHSDSTGDSPGTRKMAHASVFSSRRGSNTGSGSMPAPPNAASMNCNALPNDEHQSPMTIHYTPTAGSASPVPHHPPHSLNVHSQSQSLQTASGQVKKKSGFQITSVLPAQVSASTNNSIADDTESYDDMDESHTEDLSSSDILDVSVSRATDTGIPERSSSEETLNSLHGGETPGVVSPNEPVMHHTHSQSSQQGYMVNGTVHHGHHHQSHQPHGHRKDPGSDSVVTPQALQGAPVSSASVASDVRSVSNTVQCSAGVQGRTQRASSVQATVVEGNATGIVSHPLPSVSNSASGAIGAAIPRAGVATVVEGSFVGAAGPTGSAITGIAAVPTQPPPATTATHMQVSVASTATASRFRVVKLDSSSEPFRKGRWVCTEYYEKDAPVSASSTDAAPTHRGVESIIQSASESMSGGSTSSGTTISGGGDQGTQPVLQAFVAPVSAHHPGLPQTLPQLHTFSQDPGMHSVVSTAVVPPNNPQIFSVPGLLGTEGQYPPQHQVPYTLEGQTSQVQSTYPVNQQPNVSVNQALQSVDYGQISQGPQATPQPQQMSQLQGGVAPRATPVPNQIPGLSDGTTVAAPQTVSPRPQVPAPQMVFGQGNTKSQAQQHPPQIPVDQQQSVSQPSFSSSSTSVQNASSVPSSTLQSNLQPVLTQTLQHGVPVAGHASALGLTLRHQGGQSSQLPPTGVPYGGMVPFTASQLEDAGRLLFQHQSLLSLPRLTTGGVAALIGQTASEQGGTLGQDGSASADASALATSASTDEESSSGASVVAIDNKIEQAMDLVKSHLMYAVREEVEVLKEQIKELLERNSQLEQENNLLKNLASPEQLAQFQTQVQANSPTTQPGSMGGQQSLPPNQSMGPPV